jgi:hypothetical protein
LPVALSLSLSLLCPRQLKTVTDCRAKIRSITAQCDDKLEEEKSLSCCGICFSRRRDTLLLPCSE